MPYLKVVQRSEIQYVYPNPSADGSKLIFFTPLPDGKAGFRAGVNEENQFAD
jgi:hypothetical protein